MGIIREIENEFDIQTRTSDIRTCCSKLGALRYALIEHASPTLVENGPKDQILTNFIGLLGALESSLHLGNKDRLEENFQAIQDSLDEVQKIIDSHKVESSVGLFSLPSNKLQAYKKLTNEFNEMNVYFRDLEGKSLKELIDLCRHVQKPIKGKAVEDWGVGHTDTLPPVLKVLYAPFQKKPGDILDPSDRAVLQKAINDAPNIIHNPTPYQEDWEKQVVYQSIEEGPQPLASCHPTADGLIELLGQSETKTNAGGNGQTAINDAVTTALNALKSSNDVIVSIGARGADDGHSYTLVKTGSSVTVLESWAGRAQFPRPESDLVGVQLLKKGENFVGGLLKTVGMTPPVSMTVEEAIKGVTMLGSPNPKDRSTGHNSFSPCYSLDARSYEQQIDLEGKTQTKHIHQSTHSLKVSTAVLKPIDEATKIVEQAVTVVKNAALEGKQLSSSPGL